MLNVMLSKMYRIYDFIAYRGPLRRCRLQLIQFFVFPMKIVTRSFLSGGQIASTWSGECWFSTRRSDTRSTRSGGIAGCSRRRRTTRLLPVSPIQRTSNNIRRRRRRRRLHCPVLPRFILAATTTSRYSSWCTRSASNRAKLSRYSAARVKRLTCRVMPVPLSQSFCKKKPAMS